VRAIDTHEDLVDLEVTSNLNAEMASTQPTEDVQAQPFAANQLARDVLV